MDENENIEILEFCPLATAGAADAGKSLEPTIGIINLGCQNECS